MSKPLAKQLAETIDSLVRQFRDLPQRVDFSTDYRTRLPRGKVKTLAKHLDRVGEVFLADDLREAYKRLHEAVFAKPVDPASLTLTDAEEQRLAAMNDKDRRLAMELFGSEEQLQRDLQRTADRLVEVLEEVKGEGGNGPPKPRTRKRRPYKTDNDPEDDRKVVEDWEAAKRSGAKRIAEYCEARGLNEAHVRAAIDRHRKR